MAEYVLDTSAAPVLNLGASGVEEILQNVRVILSTPRGSVPLDRTFGIRAAILDLPLPEAMAVYTGEASAAVQLWEPRARITAVDFKRDEDGAMDGRLNPIVTLQIIGGDS